MRTVSFRRIVETTADLVVSINRKLPGETARLIKAAYRRETDPVSRDYLDVILKNMETAGRSGLPLCQDTGMAIVFVEMGSRVHADCGPFSNLEDVINEGIRNGSREGYLRPSVVTPVSRKNTGTNTPAVVHLLPVAEDVFRITVMAKGFGSENVSATKMLKPSDGIGEIEMFVIETIRNAGPNPCPPVFVGIGIGGTFEKAALLAKTALAGIGGREQPEIVRLERKLLGSINRLGIGPGGFGGRTTALGVSIRTFPTHIAGLPVSVSISCWAHRKGSVCL